MYLAMALNLYSKTIKLNLIQQIIVPEFTASLQAVKPQKPKEQISLIRKAEAVMFFGFQFSPTDVKAVQKNAGVPCSACTFESIHREDADYLCIQYSKVTVVYSKNKRLNDKIT